MPPADNDAEFRNYAGTVLWPANPAPLADTTTCPACFTPLSQAVCRTCGLDLAHPSAGDLAAVSKAASDALSRRVDLIGRIRYETTHAATPVAATEAIPPAEPAAPATPPTTPTPPPIATAEPPAPAGPRRSGVQVALLIAGVSLLSIFAIFFLVYAFINYGIVWRSVIIASVTVAAFVSASVLRRRSLIASAEGLAVFALVLVYLDAYALRANDFFGLASADGAVYWGATTTIASVLFIAWHRLSAVRAASVVGWAGVPLGIGVLAWGINDGAEPFTRIFVALTAAAVAGLTHVRVARPPFSGTVERMLVLSAAVIALSAGLPVSWGVEITSYWGGAIACCVLAVVGLVHAGAAFLDSSGTGATRAFGYAFATIGGIAAASAASAGAVRFASEDLGFAVYFPAVAATTVCLILAARRGLGSRLHQAAAFASWGALTVLGLTLLLPISSAAAPIATALRSAIGYPWTAPATLGLALAEPPGDLAVLALASVVALAGAFWLLAGSVRRHGASLAWGSAVVLVLAAAQLPSLWLTLGGWLMLAVGSWTLLRRTFAMPLAYRACLWAVLAASTTLIFVIGWVSLDTWVATTLATVVILSSTRMLASTPEIRAALLGGAMMLLLVAAAAAPRHLTWEASLPPALGDANSSIMVTIASSVLLALAAFRPLRIVSRLDRRTVFWITGPAAATSALIAVNILAAEVPGNHPELLLAQPVTSLLAGTLLFGALLLWTALRVNASLRPERIAASVAIAPTVLWVVDSFAEILGLPQFAQSVVPITAALLTAAGALTISLLRPGGTPRWVKEAGVALVALPAVVTAVTSAAPSGWLVLVLAAVTALLISVSSDGLFSSRSSRRYWGWIALALATAGLWWRLSSERVEALEPYLLPLAGALLVIAYFIQRTNQAAPDAASRGRVAPLIALSGMLVAIVPLAANSIGDDSPRAVIIFGASAVLLLVGSHAVRAAAQSHLDAMALAGAIGVLVTAAGNAWNRPRVDLVVDGWLIALLAVLLAAAIGQARARPEPNPLWRRVGGETLAIVAIVVPVLLQAEGFTDTTLGFVRAIATLALACALHIIAFAVDRAPFTRTLALAAMAAAFGSAVIAHASEAVSPVELAALPLAVALLVTGRIRLSAEPAARSWRALAPGLIILLLPSLLATTVEPELWRLVGLGMAAVTVLIVGAVRRLQAPFVLGLIVVLIHGFGTFAPQIRAVYESQEWWLWAGLAGVVLVLLAIRYEKRIQSLKDAVGRIAALR